MNKPETEGTDAVGDASVTDATPPAGGAAESTEKAKGKRGRPPKAPGAPKAPYKRRVPRDGSGKPAKRKPATKKGSGATEGGSDATNEAERAITPKPTQRGNNDGWLKVGGWGEATRTPTALREKAREILAELGYPELANIIVDVNAKDSDKLRAIDILAKTSVGYMTPEMASGEDSPELPPPIFATSEGALPGDGELLDMEMDGEEDGQSRGVPDDGSVIPMPRPIDAPPVEPPGHSGPIPFVSVR